ncbi:MAG TPA: carboxypeptidase-like regulatory domain-containing protein, partial [Saprospiraceae bacterium]|nr:carboxypeptidase-like regulatory domain-containing protein [Saprospiraceae bacterium]
MRNLFIIIIMTICTLMQSQNSTIKGVVKDKVTEAALIGANIIFVSNTENIGTITDENGKFSIPNVTPGRHTIQVSYLGYETSTIPNILVTSGKESILEITLEEGIQVLNEVVVSASADKDKALNEMATISARTFSLEEVTRYSGGRNDASRLVSNFAGVSTAND